MPEVLNDRRAMREAIEYMKDRPVCLDLIFRIQGTILEGARDQELGRGQLRKSQNWIAQLKTESRQAAVHPCLFCAG